MKILEDCQPIKASKWEAWIAFKTEQLHKAPKLSPGATPATADKAVWEAGGAELCYTKEEHAIRARGNTVLTYCKSADEARRQFARLVALAGDGVKDDIDVVKKVYRPTLFGGLKAGELIYGSVYLNKDDKDLAASDVEGVIHNPNYPGISLFSKGIEAIKCQLPPQPNTRLITYLAAAIGAGVATFFILRKQD